MLTVTDLSIRFERYGRGLARTAIVPVHHLDLDVGPGEIVAVIGASGSGKSLLAHAVLGILPDNCRVDGEIRFKGEPLTPARQKALRGREMVLVPQSVGFLNPLKNVGAQVRRAAILGGAAGSAAPRVTDAAFSRYGLAPPVQALFPFQVSGGMARRVLTATATVGRADLIVADEPTTGLDREASEQSMAFLRQLADEGRSVMVISHDLSAVLPVADRVAVFLSGTTVEGAPAGSFNGHPEALRHPYSRDMWRALPDHEFDPGPDRAAGPAGSPGAAGSGGSGGAANADDGQADGCPYARRCARADAACVGMFPPKRHFGRDFVRCRHA
ncbi:ABC transporter ATP-binding protein [Desulfovibrio sulfodismutans]|uniref:Nickel import system ATP-binding protein NikD n=1 Tax=Desulfolutivibrio sulfodismutans TaxID=63561 RepID=A0A7K3NNN2_9BACT|nr:ATP-binding cassette domain-containing protein [Desulfolutivibrio sulfodismutans]NDY57791.1 ABC transporter ATP-binding protein [Desulfolutivibrio sulfodismutans]